MAAGVIAKPGTKYGPCKNECVHLDCKRTRHMANSACNECGEIIGYQTRFYNMGDPGSDEKLFHAACIEE